MPARVEIEQVEIVPCRVGEDAYHDAGFLVNTFGHAGADDGCKSKADQQQAGGSHIAILHAFRGFITAGFVWLADEPVLDRQEEHAMTIKVASPLPYRVFQRSANGIADIPVSGRCDGPVEFRLGDSDWQPAESSQGRFSGVVRGVPVGGPHTLEVRSGSATRTIRNLLVGDLWILAGQSNMDGYGKMVDLEAPCRMVHAYYYDETWGIARDPLCVLDDSIDPVHWVSDDPAERARSVRWRREQGNLGAGLGIRFGKYLYEATGVPVGLLVCSHGGTSMARWNPELRSEGGRSLYGSMLRRVREAGGRVAGCLWYQGESDALEVAGLDYGKNLRALVEQVRADVEDPEMPFIQAQLGTYFADDASMRDAWNRVQIEQLALESDLANVATVAAIDATLCDIIHADARSLRKIGALMALQARRLRFGEAGIEPGPRPVDAAFADSGRATVRVRFSGVNGTLQPAARIVGFSAESGETTIHAVRCVRESPTNVVIGFAEPLPAGSTLWHGRGINPACNLRDSFRFPVPVFRVVLE